MTTYDINWYKNADKQLQFKIKELHLGYIEIGEQLPNSKTVHKILFRFFIKHTIFGIILSGIFIIPAVLKYIKKRKNG